MLNLITFNRWWDSGRVESIYLKPYKRPLFYELQKFMSVRQILLIYGLRRVGKTTLLYQLIDGLLSQGVERKHILYFSFDERITSLKELLMTYSEFVLGKDLLKEKRIYVFLDEIQKLEDWENQIKIFYDLYPNIKFILSGSASLSLSRGVKESLAGRVYEFILPLLTFSEYLGLQGEAVEKGDTFNMKFLREVYLRRERLAPLFYSYLKKGGFIELFDEEDDTRIREYARSLLERVIFGDIPSIFQIRSPHLLRTLLQIITDAPGFLLDYSKVAQSIGRDPRLVSDYIFYLKHALLIRVLYNFSESRFAQERKLKKVYPASTNFIYQSCPERFSDPVFLGKLVKNICVISSQAEFFWKRKEHEVDMVLEDRTPVEVKFKTRITRDDFKGIIRFHKRYPRDKGIIITRDELGKEEIGSLEVFLIPAWLYLLCSAGS